MKRRQFIVAFGGVAVWPFVWPVGASAQKPKLHRVGFLSPGSFTPETYPGRLTGELTERLSQKGFTPGVNLELIRRGAEGHLDRLPGLVAELVASKVDVIVAFSYRVAAAAKEGASSVPTVIFSTGDPVKTHLVASLNRPGGNITGISDVAAELRRSASNC
jgi:putative ABC transport system substrate-binding protein